jgi:hypothetical protein
MCGTYKFVCFPHMHFRVYHQKIWLGINQSSKQHNTLVVKMVSKFKGFLLNEISPSHFQASPVEFYFCIFFFFFFVFSPQPHKWWAMYNLGFTAIGHHNNQCLYTHTHTKTHTWHLYLCKCKYGGVVFYFIILLFFFFLSVDFQI